MNPSVQGEGGSPIDPLNEENMAERLILQHYTCDRSQFVRKHLVVFVDADVRLQYNATTELQLFNDNSCVLECCNTAREPEREQDMD